MKLRTTPVVWASTLFLGREISSSNFGTECLRIEPPHYTQGLFSPQNTTGVLLLWWGIIWDAENGIWWNLVFHPFGHPFCWMEMGQNGVPGQLLLRFAPFLLQWYSLSKCRLFIWQWNKLGQLVVRYDRLVVKSGLHAAGNQACAPKLGNIKQKCSGTFWCIVWNCPISGPIRGKHLKNMPILGGVVHLC